MSLLQLKDIGKIYVSEGNVSVGIRGVNLSFDKGEFVAITGASGSGKSTLLNVISGMDTYEEGELFIENEPTSHFMQPDWEEYRKKYISFIFQEYNIIESYTVLQNVELALMHIENKKERRARAIDLLTRVGMKDHLKSKGSKLSGGQKQRTVIARALAKDSPIILADEPTGNLDSQTSVEIIELMKEVAKDKLLIVVTHNYEQVEDHVTRHIRVYDGAVESDQAIRPVSAVSEDTAPEKAPEKKAGTVKKKLSDVKNGFTLGGAIFKATPKLSFFMCLLMLIGTLGIFLSISTMGDFTEMFEPTYMFNDIEGRVVLVKRTGEVITDKELEDIKATYGAESYIHYDSLLDKNMSYDWASGIEVKLPNGRNTYISPNYVFGENITPAAGRLPEKENELLLSLPISYQPTFGSTELKITDVKIDGMEYKLVGVHYYADNNLTPKALLSESGFKFMSVYNKAFGSDNMGNSDFYMFFNAYFYEEGAKDGGYKEYPSRDNIYKDMIGVSFDESVVPNGKIALMDSEYLRWEENAGKDVTINRQLSFHYNYYSWNGANSTNASFNENITVDKLVFKNDDATARIIFSPKALIEIMEKYMSVSYTQASVFFKNDAAAATAAEDLNTKGYLAVPANTTYEPDPLTMITNTIGCIFTLILFAIITVFLAFFVNLCSSRTLGAFKGDMAIMRSMGITVSVIKAGMYVRMYASLIPAFILLAVCPILVGNVPTINGFLKYLYGYQYAIIILCMILLTYSVTHRQVKKLFNESVKKSLKGGNAE